MSMTARTSEDTDIQRHRLAVSTPAACLTRIGRIDSDELASSFFRFGTKSGKEGRPGDICNAFSKTMVVHHAIDGQILNGNDTKSIDNGTSMLMGEVVPFPGDTLMHTGDSFAVLSAVCCALCQCGVLALDLGQGLLFLTEKAWVLDLFTRRQGGKCLESDINPNLVGALGQALRFTLDRETGIPLAGAALVDGQGLDLSSYRTVIVQLDRSHLGDDHASIMREGKARLWEGETIVAVAALEPWKPRLFGTRAHAAEEGFESQINPHRYILQDLRMHGFEGGSLVFEQGKRIDLLIAGERLPCLFIGRLSSLKQVIIEPATFLKDGMQLANLLLGWVETILKHFMHILILAQQWQEVKREAAPLPAPDKEHAFHPHA
jgi:hypothetical protein